MKPPAEVCVRRDLQLMTWAPRGVLDEPKVNQILAFIAEEEAASDASELRFIDTTGLSAVDLNFNYVFHVSLYRRLTRAGKRSLKTACFVNDDALAHYFQLHAMVTD